MSKLEHALYHCDQIKVLEQHATRLYDLDEDELMNQAGKSAWFLIKKLYPKVKHIAFFCGAGNNAGDGYVVARLAHEQGLSVLVYQCKAIDELSGPARNVALMALAAGIDCQSSDETLDSDVELIVDALLGTGLKGPVHGAVASAIHQINSSDLPVISLDIPSGLNADTGYVENFCVKASVTLTFIGLKSGMYTLDGPDYCGEIHCCPLQLESFVEKLTPCATLLSPDLLPIPMPARKQNSHKGDYGHVLVVGGGPGMPGAAVLAAKAALRTGAGAVTVATWPDHARGSLPSIPEAMVWGVKAAKDLEPLLSRASFCILGPGLGDTEWAKTLFFAAIRRQLPMVLDASALRLLAEFPQTDDNWVLTPHPGEAGSLLSCSTEVIQMDRYQSAIELQQQYGGVVVLKGTGTIVQTIEKNTWVCPRGNPGMASAGMGDVLSGIIAGLCVQGLSLSDAAKLGVWVHAVAGDSAARSRGGPGILASDLFDYIPEILSANGF